MNETRKEFCLVTIECIEVKIQELLSWINQHSDNEQDAATSAAILNLINARAALLAEAAAYELEDEA